MANPRPTRYPLAGPGIPRPHQVPYGWPWESTPHQVPYMAGPGNPRPDRCPMDGNGNQRPSGARPMAGLGDPRPPPAALWLTLGIHADKVSRSSGASLHCAPAEHQTHSSRELCISPPIFKSCDAIAPGPIPTPIPIPV